MPATEATPVACSESGIVKMEDRKRPATHDHNDSAPPLKKQATSINGGSKPHPDADMPWKDDLEVSCSRLLLNLQFVAGRLFFSLAHLEFS